MAKKKILMVCEAFGGGVFTYVSQKEPIRMSLRFITPKL